MKTRIMILACLLAVPAGRMTAQQQTAPEQKATVQTQGDSIIITITIIPDIIPAAVAIGEEAVIGEIPIQTDVHLEVLVEIGSLPMEEVLQPDVLLM